MVGKFLKVNKAQFNNSIRQPTSNINFSLLYVVCALWITSLIKNILMSDPKKKVKVIWAVIGFCVGIALKFLG